MPLKEVFDVVLCWPEEGLPLIEHQKEHRPARKCMLLFSCAGLFEAHVHEAPMRIGRRHAAVNRLSEMQCQHLSFKLVTECARAADKGQVIAWNKKHRRTLHTTAVADVEPRVACSALAIVLYGTTNLRLDQYRCS